jgi:hypothetical protein
VKGIRIRSADRIFYALALVVLVTAADTFAAPTLHGTVETQAGERLEGPLRFENQDLVLLNPAGGERKVAASELKVAKLRLVGSGSSALRAAKRMPGLRGSYYRSPEFGGGPPNERVDSVIDFEWSSKAPLPGFPRENFSVRWRGEIETTTAGNYGFHTNSDDGVRLWIDHRLLIDRWLPQPSIEYSGQINLEARRRYPIVLEYFQGSAMAGVKLRWTPPGAGKDVIPAPQLSHESNAAGLGEKNGLLGFYFNSPDLSGKPVHRVDPFIDSPWRNRPPSPDFKEGRFSVRWEGEVAGPLTGKVTFQTSADDGVRLWVDGHLLVDQWRPGSSQVQAEFLMEAGKRYPIRMEYYQGGGGLHTSLAWSGPGLSHQLIPQSRLFTSSDVTIPLYSGVILKGGSFLAGEVKKMTRTELEITTSGPEGAPIRIPRVYLAAVIFDSSDPAKLALVESRKAGCLLRRGDYLESSDLSIEEGKVVAGSILLGRRTFLPDQVPMIKLASHKIASAMFELRTRSGSILRVNSLTLDGEKALVKDNSNFQFTLQPGKVASVYGIVGK